MTCDRWQKWETRLMREEYAETQNEAFARVLGRSVDSVSRKAYAMGLKKSPTFVAELRAKLSESGRASRFGAGLTPWNKGANFRPGGRSAETQFRKGNRPQTWVPVGTYRINGDGYLDRKVTDEGRGPRDWVGVHRLVWVAHNGPVPGGHVVVFKPGRRTTELEAITPDALECITRVELMNRNTVHRLPKELARAVQLRGALMRQINMRTPE